MYNEDVDTRTRLVDADQELLWERGCDAGGRAGLESKSYLLQGKTQGSPRNPSAPFSVWRDVDGMRNFLRDFGRQPIQDWTVPKLSGEPGDDSQAKSLSITSVRLPTGLAPADCLDAITKPSLSRVGENTIALVTAVDVTTWSTVFAETSADILTGAKDHRPARVARHHQRTESPGRRRAPSTGPESPEWCQPYSTLLRARSR